MRKIFLAFAFAMLSSGSAYALPANNEVSLNVPVNAGSGAGAGRRFNTTRTDSSLGCTIQTGTTCPYIPDWSSIRLGYNPAGKACCYYFQNTQALEVYLDKQASKEGAELEGIMNGTSTETYYGYISTTNRSPSTGRGNSAQAKLDACLNHSNWDPSGSYPTCLSTCGDGSKNGHCSDNSNAVCIDRCECVYEQAGCNNL